MNTIVQCVPEQSEHEVRACEPRSPLAPDENPRIARCRI